MNRWLLLVVSTMTLATFSLSAYCSSCGSRSSKGGNRSHYSKNSHQHRHARLNTYYSENSRYRDRQDDQYMSGNDRDVLKGIHEGLASQGFDYDQNNVQVSVRYGKVVFDGRVDSEQEKELLREVAISLPNVKNVIVDVHVDDIDPDYTNNNSITSFRK